MRIGALPNGRASAPLISNTLLPHYSLRLDRSQHEPYVNMIYRERSPASIKPDNKEL
jgi:hypothetical protein